MNMVRHGFDIVEKATFRNCMSRLGSAVNVVTTRYGGERYGFTASAVCSVSDTPATLLVCINRVSSCFHAFENTRHFCVNTLMPGQEDISNVFGGKTPTEDRFTLGEWREDLTGVPILVNASVSFECELTNEVDEATHRVLFGRAINVRENEEDGTLLYCMRRYLNGYAGPRRAG
ncbi:flavin reductase [Sinorhizobium sp. RAC02]|uniref:flavin reductase n=1 Tax=Sinorhizobium sp. RAC02 TaxID=1842534 RepID=UPI00083E102A|nr:flavin reductase [Sinorhizobium sp. RAC02]AOF92541.1 NAD(P)H-flavin reductase RutF domain protein [Sinorhizobium sp. RAC02]